MQAYLLPRDPPTPPPAARIIPPRPVVRQAGGRVPSFAVVAVQVGRSRFVPAYTLQLQAEGVVPKPLYDLRSLSTAALRSDMAVLVSITEQHRGVPQVICQAVFYFAQGAAGALGVALFKELQGQDRAFRGGRGGVMLGRASVTR